MGMSLSGLEWPYACVPAASQPPVAASATFHGLAIIGTPRQVRGPFTAPFPRGSGHSLCGQKCDVMCGLWRAGGLGVASAACFGPRLCCTAGRA